MSTDIVQEKVPRFVKRIGDVSYQGSNNTIIILGTDRSHPGPATVDHGLGSTKSEGNGKASGTIHIIAGRGSENPDFKEDKSFLYITARSDVDKNLELESVEKTQNNAAALIGKSDNIRLVARAGKGNIKVSMSDGKNYIFADDKKITVRVGENFVELDADKLVAKIGQSSLSASKSGDIKVSNTKSELVINNDKILAKGPHFKIGGAAASEWNRLFGTIITLLATHDHITVVGPTLPAGTSTGQFQIPAPLGSASAVAWPTLITVLESLKLNCFE